MPMPDWAQYMFLGIFAVLFVWGLFSPGKPDPQRIDWKSWRLAMRRGWRGSTLARTDYTEVVHLQLDSLRPDQNAYADKLVQERDVMALARYLMAESDLPREKCIDLAERCTGREYIPDPEEKT